MMKCPQCSGDHFADHPGGLLVFQHKLTCPLLKQLDETQAHEAATLGAAIEREANASERVLAIHLDPSLAGKDFKIAARRVTASIINRSIIRI